MCSINAAQRRINSLLVVKRKIIEKLEDSKDRYLSKILKFKNLENI